MAAARFKRDRMRVTLVSFGFVVLAVVAIALESKWSGALNAALVLMLLSQMSRALEFWVNRDYKRALAEVDKHYAAAHGEADQTPIHEEPRLEFSVEKRMPPEKALEFAVKTIRYASQAGRFAGRAAVSEPDDGTQKRPSLRPSVTGVASS